MSETYTQKHGVCLERRTDGTGRERQPEQRFSGKGKL